MSTTTPDPSRQNTGRARGVYANADQRAILRKAHAESARLSAQQKADLAAATGLEPAWISAWFKRANSPRSGRSKPKSKPRPKFKPSATGSAQQTSSLLSESSASVSSSLLALDAPPTLSPSFSPTTVSATPTPFLLTPLLDRSGLADLTLSPASNLAIDPALFDLALCQPLSVPLFSDIQSQPQPFAPSTRSGSLDGVTLPAPALQDTDTAAAPLPVSRKIKLKDLQALYDQAWSDFSVRAQEE